MPPEGAVIDPPVISAPPAPVDWRTHLTDELKADPVVSKWAEKASEKDIPGLIKGYAHTFTKMGSAINLPGKDAKPEDVAALRTKLYEAGVFTAPPADPKEYGLTKIENLPDGLQWSDELAGKFATALHKHGVPKAALADLLPLYLDALGGSVNTLTVDREQSLATLKAEHGEQYDARVEAVKRISQGLFRTPEELQFFEQTGLGDHPAFLSVMLRLAPLALQDSSFMESLPSQGGAISGDAAREEYAKIISDPAHPMHAGYLRKDPKVESYINDLYKRAYGTEPVVI